MLTRPKGAGLRGRRGTPLFRLGLGPLIGAQPRLNNLACLEALPDLDPRMKPAVVPAPRRCPSPHVRPPRVPARIHAQLGYCPIGDEHAVGGVGVEDSTIGMPSTISPDGEQPQGLWASKAGEVFEALEVGHGVPRLPSPREVQSQAPPPKPPPSISPHPSPFPQPYHPRDENVHHAAPL